MPSNPHEGHRKRLRRELLEQDFADSIEAHKILELLLFYGIPRKDTNEIAHELINKFGSFHAVFEADISDLLQVKGMTENAATLIKLLLPISRRYHTDKYKSRYKFSTFNDVGDFLKEMHSGYREEVFMVTTMKNNGEKIACDIISKGDMSSVALSVKAIVQVVLKHNAPCVVISHNHTSKNALPSKPDIEMTQNLKYMLEQLGVKLLDHIIVAGDDYVSMAQSSQYSSIFK